MASFNRRVFGASVDENVREKLQARQQTLAGKGVGDLQYKEILNTENLAAGYEGSSRTVFSRMWTAVDSIPLISKEKLTELQKASTSVVGLNIDLFDRKVRGEEERLKAQSKIKPKFYIVGNYNDEQLKINEPVDPTYYNLGEHNDFLKQSAGITSVKTTTEGSLGALQSVDVSFKVNNFHDFENVFSKYFLRPGAVVVVDVGWNTAKLYDPQKVLNKGSDIKDIIGRQSIVDRLYEDDGVVQQSAGDLMVFGGHVIDYSSKVNADGTFDCSLKIVSANRGILDQNIESESAARDRLENRLDTFILVNVYNQFMQMADEDDKKGYLSINEVLSNPTLNINKINNSIWMIFHSDNANDTLHDISPQSSLIGLWMKTETETNEELKERFNNDEKAVDKFRKEVGIAYKPVGPAYASFGWLEDNLFNVEYSITTTTPSGNISRDVIGGGSFDTSEVFIYINPTIRKYVEAMLNEGDYPIIAFPKKYDISYNSVLNKIPTEHNNLPKGEKSRSKWDGVNNRIPLREVFFNVDKVKAALTGTKFRVAEAITSLLEDINSEFPIYDFDLFTPSRDFTTVSIVDKSKMSKDNQKFKEDEFVFTPFSDTSMVYDLDLSYNVPKGGLQSMIAIQSSSPNNIIPSGNSTVRAQAHLRRLFMDKDEKMFIKHLSSTKDNNTFKVDEVAVANKNNSDDIGARRKKAVEKLSLDFSQQISAATAHIEAMKVNKKAPGTVDPPDKEVQVTDKINSCEYTSEVYRSMLEGKTAETAPMMPYELSLTIYGTSGIYPGDLVTIDYLPQRVKDKASFIVTSVSHDITSDWKTTIATQMKLKDIPPSDFKEINIAPPKTMTKEDIDEVQKETPPEINPEAGGNEGPKVEVELFKPPVNTKQEYTFGGGGIIPFLVHVDGVDRAYLEKHVYHNKHRQTLQAEFQTTADVFLGTYGGGGGLGKFFSIGFLIRQFIKQELNERLVRGSFANPIFSANPEVSNIYEKYGYKIVSCGSLIKPDVFAKNLKALERDTFLGIGADLFKDKFNSWYKNAFACSITFRYEERYLVVVSKKGSGLPFVTKFHATGKPPEPYGGYGNVPAPTGWDNEIWGPWKSDQNGHILDNNKTLTWNDLQTMSDAELLIYWRQTPRGAVTSTYDQDLKTLRKHFQTWSEKWMNEKLEAETDAKLLEIAGSEHEQYIHLRNIEALRNVAFGG